MYLFLLICIKLNKIIKKLLKLIREMSEERKINDFEHLNHLTKDTYSKAQLFIELLQLVRQESIIMNQSAPFGKITFGLL
jgi:chromatin segregation and condensation protein Rec8/ScpA/Scc1 (kleisin family)